MLTFLFLWACTSQKDVVFDFESSGDSQTNNQPETIVEEPVDDTAQVGEPSEPETTQPASEPESVPSETCDRDSTGTEEGECGSNFALMNENDNMVELYDYQGDVIFLDLSSFT